MNSQNLTKPYNTWLIKHLSDPEEALTYLEVAVEEYESDGDKHAFLKALRNIAEAQGGIGALAQKTGLNREHLYRALSESGNPRFQTIGKILHGLGFKLSVKKITAA